MTPAQLATLLADTNTNTNTVSVNGGPQTAIKNVPRIGDAAFAVAAWYNLLPATSFFGYYNAVPVASIRGSIIWKKITSNAAMPASPSTDISHITWINACLNVQANLELLLGTNPNATVDATQPNVVQGFADALSAVPSKADGTSQDAGWTTTVTGLPVPALTVPQVLSRLATNAEKLFANTTAWAQGGSGATQTPGATGPALLTFEGTVQPSDVAAAWGITI